MIILRKILLLLITISVGITTTGIVVSWHYCSTMEEVFCPSEKPDDDTCCNKKIEEDHGCPDPGTKVLQHNDDFSSYALLAISIPPLLLIEIRPLFELSPAFHSLSSFATVITTESPPPGDDLTVKYCTLLI